jgi:hypothetical protein
MNLQATPYVLIDDKNLRIIRYSDDFAGYHQISHSGLVFRYDCEKRQYVLDEVKLGGI